MSSVSVDELVKKNKALDTRVDTLKRKIGGEEDYEISRLVNNRSAEATATVVARSKRDMEYCQYQFDTAGVATNVSSFQLILPHYFSILI